MLLKRIKKREERQTEEIRYGRGIYVFLGKVLSRRAPRWGAMTRGGGRYESSFPEIPISLYLIGRR